MEMLTKERILEKLTGNWGKPVRIFEETDSTNIQCADLALKGWPEGTLVAAESQTAGKGRRGRSWESPAGTGIWMSLLLRPKIPAEKASMLTLVAALAVQKGIEKETGIHSMIKWPNDLVIGSKKVCGILTEMRSREKEPEYVIIGIGINANMTEFPDEIQDRATSLYLETGRKADRAGVIAGILAAFEDDYKRFLKTCDLSRLKDEYDAGLINRGRQVKILAPFGSYTGLCQGIEKEGGLMVELPDGSKETIVSGEVSVRGVYGYA